MVKCILLENEIPNDAKAYYTLGQAYFMTERYQEAIAELKEAIRLNPNFAEAYWNLANIYKAQSKHEEAISAYKEAKRIDPSFAPLVDYVYS